MSVSVGQPPRSQRLLAGEPRAAPWTRYPWLAPAAAYGVLVVLCALAAYWAMFSQFVPYDDEGFFLYSLKLFMSGHALYSNVASHYGPFYYELFGGLFKLLGREVTTDLGRLAQVTMWVLASLGLGVAAHRLSGRLAIGVASMATTFMLLTALTDEPMHPEALSAVVLAALALVIAVGAAKPSKAALFGIGWLAAALVLIKVNVGLFAVVSIAFAVVLHGSALRTYAVPRRLAIAAFVLVGVALMHDLAQEWIRDYVVLVTAAAAAVALATVPVRPQAGWLGDVRSWPWWVIGGFAACIIPVLIVVVALGSSPAAIWNQLAVGPARGQSAALTRQLPVAPEVIWWSLASVGLAWTLRRVGLLGVERTVGPSLWGGVFRVLAGLAILLSLTSSFPFAISPSAPFALALPLAWVAAVPSRRDQAGLVHPLVRALIPALAVLQVLVAYPVAGTQMSLGAILFVLCAALCLGDGLAELSAWNALHALPRHAAATALSALFLVLAAGTTFEFVLQPLTGFHDQYRAGAALHIHGANRVRTPPAQAAALTEVTNTLRARCQTLLSMPALYSFDVWTGLPTPSPRLGEQTFWTFLSSAEQRQVVQAARASPGLCVVRDDGNATAYNNGHLPSRTPLVAYIEDDFVRFADIGGYTLWSQRSAPAS